MRLQELTGYESGVVIFKETEEGIVTNWSSIDGIPRIFVTGIVGLGDGEDLQKVDNSEHEDFAINLANASDCDDQENIIDGIWENETVVVFVFKDWN